MKNKRTKAELISIANKIFKATNNSSLTISFTNHLGGNCRNFMSLSIQTYKGDEFKELDETLLFSLYPYRKDGYDYEIYETEANLIEISNYLSKHNIHVNIL